MTSDTSWWTWRKKVTDGRIAEARMGVTLAAVDARGVATAQWTLFNAWLSKLVQTSNADGTVVEVLTLTTEAIDRKK